MAVDRAPIQAIYNKLNQLTAYHPGSTEIFDDFLQEAGDVVQVVSDGESFDFPIFSQHMTWTGSMLTTMQSTGNKTRNALPPLQRREKNRGYRFGQQITEQEELLHGYYNDFIQEKTVIGMISGAMGVALDQDGNPIVDPTTGEFQWDDEHGAELFSRLLLSPNRAQLISAINANTGGGTISYAKVDLSGSGNVLIQAVNQRSDSSVTIDADKINLLGVVTSTQMDSRLANIDALFTTTGYAGTIYANGLSATSGEVSDLTVGTFKIRNTPSSTATVTRKGVKIGNGAVSDSLLLLGTGSDSNLQIPNAVTHFGSSSASGGTISIPYYTYDSGGGQAAGNITFNIADTAYYQSHIGISSTGSWAWDYDETEYYRTITPNAGASVDVKLPTITVSAGSWSGSSCPVTVYGPNNHVITSTTVSASSIVGISSVTLNGPSTTAYSSGTDQGTLTADRYYQVAATPNSGSTVYIKFKTPSGGTSYNYTPDDIRLGNVSYYASMASGGTEWSTLATSIHANKGKSGYVRFTADLDGYTGTSKKYYIPMSGI